MRLWRKIMGWEYTLKVWATTQIISEVGTKNNTSGCQGREMEFLVEDNVRYFALTINNSQGSPLDNF